MPTIFRRTGRTIMNYYLLIHNVSPIIIYEEDRKEYYDCLEKFDVDSELQPLKDFIIRQQEKTWTRNSKKVMKLNEIMNKDENQNTFEMNDIEESNDEMELE